MIRALYSSASGLQAQQNNLDVIANNLANVNTTGFKKSKIEFQDLLYQAKRMAGSEQGTGNQLPAGIEIGHGLADSEREEVLDVDYLLEDEIKGAPVSGNFETKEEAEAYYKTLAVSE